MSKRNLIGLAVGLAVLLVAGGLFASNMGFKLNYVLDSQGSNGSGSGTNTVALPYNQQTSLVDASDILDDIGGIAIVKSVSKFIRTDDSLQGYTGASELTNFTLTPGESYRIQIDTTVTGVSYLPSHY